jgi:hypothetical protein
VSMAIKLRLNNKVLVKIKKEPNWLLFYWHLVPVRHYTLGAGAAIRLKGLVENYVIILISI